MGQTFAMKLKELREAAGISQSELASRAGMNQFGIAKLEQGLREPALSTAQALARVLGVSLAVFDDVTFPKAEGEVQPATSPPGRPRRTHTAAQDATKDEQVPSVKPKGRRATAARPGRKKRSAKKT